MKAKITQHQKLLDYLKNKDIALPEIFIVGVLFEKLSESQSDYKNKMKHKDMMFTLEELIKHILIHGATRKQSNATKANELALKANLVQSKEKMYISKSQNQKPQNLFKKKKEIDIIAVNLATTCLSTDTIRKGKAMLKQILLKLI